MVWRDEGPPSPFSQRGEADRDGKLEAISASAPYELSTRQSVTHGSFRSLPSSAALKASLAIVLSVVVSAVLFSMCQGSYRKLSRAGMMRRRLGDSDREDDAVLKEIVNICLDMEDTWGGPSLKAASSQPSAGEDTEPETKIAKIEMELKSSRPRGASLPTRFAQLPDSQSGHSDLFGAFRAADFYSRGPKAMNEVSGFAGTATISTPSITMKEEAQQQHTRSGAEGEVEQHQQREEVRPKNQVYLDTSTPRVAVGVVLPRRRSTRFTRSDSSMALRPLRRSPIAATQARQRSTQSFASSSTLPSNPSVASTLRASRSSYLSQLLPGGERAGSPQKRSGTGLSSKDVSPVYSPLDQPGTGFQRRDPYLFREESPDGLNAEATLIGKRIRGKLYWSEAPADSGTNDFEERQGLQRNRNKQKSGQYIQRHVHSGSRGEMARQSASGYAFDSVPLAPDSFQKARRSPVGGRYSPQSSVLPQTSSSITPSQALSSPAVPVASTGHNASTPELRSAGLPQGAMPKAFRLWKVFAGKQESRHIAPLLRTIRSQLAKPQLSEEDKAALIFTSEALVNHAAHRMTGPIRQEFPGVLERLGRRFLVFEALHSVCSKLGPDMKQNLWWGLFGRRVPTRYPLPDKPHVMLSQVEQMAIRLSAALEKLKQRRHVLPEEVAALKGFLFFSTLSPSSFKRKAWDAWREGSVASQ